MKIQFIKVLDRNGEKIVEILIADEPEQETAKEWIHFCLSMRDAPADVSLADLQEEALRRAQNALGPGTKLE